MPDDLASATSPFGARLRQWRRHRGLSQLALAGQVGSTPRHVSFLETGRSRPSRDTVLRLAGALEVPLREVNQLLQAAGPASTTSRALVAPADSAARSYTAASRRSSGSPTTKWAPSASRRPHPVGAAVGPAGAAAGGRSPVRVAAEAAKVAALNQNAGATPQAATMSPANGASAIWEVTAADQRALLPATSSSSSRMAGAL